MAIGGHCSPISAVTGCLPHTNPGARKHHAPGAFDYLAPAAIQGHSDARVPISTRSCRPTTSSHRAASFMGPSDRQEVDVLIAHLQGIVLPPPLRALNLALSASDRGGVAAGAREGSRRSAVSAGEVLAALAEREPPPSPVLDQARPEGRLFARFRRAVAGVGVIFRRRRTEYDNPEQHQRPGGGGAELAAEWQGAA